MKMLPLVLLAGWWFLGVRSGGFGGAHHYHRHDAVFFAGPFPTEAVCQEAKRISDKHKEVVCFESEHTPQLIRPSFGRPEPR